MSPIKRRNDLGDDRLRVAIGYGFDFTNEKTAEFAGVSESTAKRWKQDPDILAIVGHVAAARALSGAFGVDASVGKLAERAEDRIKAVFDRSLRLTERLLQQAEMASEQPGEGVLPLLMEIHKNITVWAGKFAASEAPKRVEMKGSIDHAHIHATIPLADAENIFEARRAIKSVEGQALIAGSTAVTEAELVS